jgi:5-methylcytosine-specific restriction endonuclease McrA
VERRFRKRGKPRNRPHVSSDPGYYTKAGPVTIIHADGTSEERAALDEVEFQKQVRVRRSIPPHIRRKIIRRDRRCRYCGSESGPFEIDHRVPIALGGSNRLSNLVLACADCNHRKGASVW